jgi:hypothetical protein
MSFFPYQCIKFYTDNLDLHTALNAPLSRSTSKSKNRFLNSTNNLSVDCLSAVSHQKRK